MNDMDRGQVVQSAAEVYDQFFLPALFREWPVRVLETAMVNPGDAVLDVACGTGVLALAAAESVGANGFTAGVDINDGMLSVARKKSSTIEWRNSRAESLPYPDRSFDAVISQFGLMFFEDKRAAIREMVRVLKPGGRLAVAVWDSLENTPGYAAVTALLERLFDDQTADALRAPFMLGDKEILGKLFSDTNLESVTITTYPGKARFHSLEDWMYTEVKGWILSEQINDDQFALLLNEAREALQPFVVEDGSIAFSTPAHIVSGQRPRAWQD